MMRVLLFLGLWPRSLRVSSRRRCVIGRRNKKQHRYPVLRL